MSFTTFPVKHRPSNDYDSYRPQSPQRLYNPRPNASRPISPAPRPDFDSYRPHPPSPRLYNPRPISPRPVSPRPASPVPASISGSPILKREHRVAKIYQPRSPTLPTRPLTAHTQERPAPILQLPGLPPQELPRSVVTPRKRTFREELKDKVENGRSWLAKFRPPWVNEPSLEVIPPVTPRTSVSPQTPKTGLPATPRSGFPATPRTAAFPSTPRAGAFPATPKTAKFADEAAYPKQQEHNSDTESMRDPPPLYKKNAPEGGLRAWLSVAGAFMIQFCTIGYLFTWNVFEDHYNHVSLTDQNPTVIRFIGSVQFFLALLLSVVAGKFADSGFFRPTVHAGSFVFAICLFLLSLVEEAQFGQTFACQSIGMGIGIGLVFVPTALVPLYYFKRKRGLVIGIVMSGGSLGSMIFPPVLRALIPQRGLGGAVRVTACIVIGFMVVANFLLRTPPRARKPLYPIMPLSLVAKYTQEIGYVFAAGGTFLAMMFIYWPVMYLELLGTEQGIDPNIAFYTIVILSVSGIIGRVGLGFASDFVGPWNMMLPVTGYLALMMFTTCTIQSAASLGVYAFFYGILAGSWVSLMVTALSSLASKPNKAGTRVGLVFSISSLGILLSSLIQEGVLTPQHIWVIPSVVSGIIFMCVTALVFFSRKMILSKKAESSRRRLPVLKDIPILGGIVIL